MARATIRLTFSQPYRLVIEVHSQAAVTTAKIGTGTPAQPAANAPTSAPSKDDAGAAETNAAEKTNETVSASSEKDSATAKLAAKLAATPASKSTPLNRSPQLRAALHCSPYRAQAHARWTAFFDPRARPEIGRIVIDPGHADTIPEPSAPRLMEKDLCLDVALRLGHLSNRNFPARKSFTRERRHFHSARAAYGHGQRRQSRPVYFHPRKLKPRS